MEQDEINKEKILEESEEKKEGQIIPDKEEAKKVDRNSVPTKTKIAAWWMKVIGWGGIIFGITAFLFILLGGLEGFWHFISPIFWGLVLLIISELLLKGKKVSWIGAIILLLFFLIPYLNFIPLFGHLPFKIYEAKWYLFHPFGFISSLVLITPASAGIFGFIFVIFSVFFFPPLILLLLDRKNFWKIAS